MSSAFRALLSRTMLVVGRAMVETGLGLLANSQVPERLGILQNVAKVATALSQSPVVRYVRVQL